jgi:uncharacterized protein (UPF0264 family)
MNEKEALQAIAGGADIIDVKNPQEGPLGANYPWVIKKIREITPKNIEVSCTLGEVPNLPGSISLAALGAASLGVDYIKVGLYGFTNDQEAIYLLDNVNRAAKEYNPRVKVVVAGYADAERIGGLDPMQIPEITLKSHADVAMLDTAIKDNKNLFDFLNAEKIKKFIDYAHYLGLQAALAGTLRKNDLPILHALGADIVGIRGAACSNNDRVSGELKTELVRDLVEIIKKSAAKKA